MSFVSGGTGLAAFILVSCSSTNSGELENEPSAAQTASATASRYLGAAARCGAYGHAPCDVLDAACQTEIATIAACQWGGEGTPVTVPTITTLSRADVVQRIGMLALMEAPPEPLARAVNSVLDRLGLQPAAGDSPTGNQLTAELALALYNVETKEATLVEGATTGDASIDNALLFHELVHAQQDARYDLGALLRGVTSTDALVALRGLFEGEAQFHQLLFELGQFDASSGPASVKAQLDAFRQRQEPTMFADPASAWPRALILSGYIYGPYSTLQAWSLDGPDAMLDLYGSPPGDTLRMLETALGAVPTTDALEPFPMPNVFAQPGAPAPVEGDESWPLLADRFGAWTVLVLAERTGGLTVAHELALSWRGDQLDVFQLAAGGAAGRYRVHFDDAAHAAEFARLLGANPNTVIRASGPLVVATVSEGETPEWLFGPLAAP